MELNNATLIRDKLDENSYRVEGFTEDGGCEVAIFCGPNALDRAVCFAGGGAYYEGWGDPDDCTNSGALA